MSVMRDAILDTNVLLLLVVGFSSTSYIAEHKRTYQFSISDFENLQRLLAQFTSQSTVPHVLTEASNLLDTGHGRMREDIFKVLKAYICNQSEIDIPSQNGANSTVFNRLGLTDAILYEAASKGATIITTDQKLHHAALSAGIKSINFNEIIDHS
jgi:rRNA-processing protein FCF1